jgi:hypothetical protein
MKRIFLIFIGVVSFFGCIPCDSPITIDNGVIPLEKLSFVPYQTDKVYRFQHSAGLVIDFNSIRQSHEEWSICEECCSNEYKFEVNSTTLTPDYPIFDFGFDISNSDTTYFLCTARIGKYQFYIPTDPNRTDYFQFVDSIFIVGQYYHNVFKLKSDYGSYYDTDSIYADSLYYSYEKGIIQIKMSNGEKYTIYE